VVFLQVTSVVQFTSQTNKISYFFLYYDIIRHMVPKDYWRTGVDKPRISPDAMIMKVRNEESCIKKARHSNRIAYLQGSTAIVLRIQNWQFVKWTRSLHTKKIMNIYDYEISKNKEWNQPKFSADSDHHLPRHRCNHLIQVSLSWNIHNTETW
jgi:hypothetical protein